MPARISPWRPTDRFSNHTVRDEGATVKRVCDNLLAGMAVSDQTFAGAVTDALGPAALSIASMVAFL